MTTIILGELRIPRMKIEDVFSSPHSQQIIRTWEDLATEEWVFQLLAESPTLVDPETPASVGWCLLCRQELLRTADDCWHPHTVERACPPEPASLADASPSWTPGRPGVEYWQPVIEASFQEAANLWTAVCPACQMVVSCPRHKDASGWAAVHPTLCGGPTGRPGL